MNGILINKKGVPLAPLFTVSIVLMYYLFYSIIILLGDHLLLTLLIYYFRTISIIIVGIDSNFNHFLSFTTKLSLFSKTMITNRIYYSKTRPIRPCRIFRIEEVYGALYVVLTVQSILSCF